MLGLLKAKMAGTLSIPEGKSILIPYGEGRLLGSKTFDFSIINAPISLGGGRLRSNDRPQTRFRIDTVKKISLNDYLPQFVYFETVTIHLLSLIHANTLDEYYIKQDTYRDVELISRIQELREIAKKNKIRNIGKLSGLLQVRNEIAHNLYPNTIAYNGKVRPYDDKTLVSEIKNDSDKVMTALLQLYERYTARLDSWLQPIIDKTPAQVIFKADGTREIHEKQY